MNHDTTKFCRHCQCPKDYSKPEEWLVRLVKNGNKTPIKREICPDCANKIQEKK